MTIHPSKYIGHDVYVELKDERLLSGILIAIDPFGNLLVSNVTEKSKDKVNKNSIHTREIGLVSVPRHSLVSIKMKRNDWYKIHNIKTINGQQDESVLS